jgi:hypothetical protein
MSINTQSLLSKHNNIKSMLSILSDQGLDIDILAIQETWRILYTELVQIPGYTFIHKHRTDNRGGGVGFYIKNNITFKILPNLSPFSDNLFESLTINANIAGKNYLLTTIYKSTTPPRNTTHADHNTLFIAQLDKLLSDSQKEKLTTYIFLDSNINLLNLQYDIGICYQLSRHHSKQWIHTTYN